MNSKALIVSVLAIAVAAGFFFLRPRSEAPTSGDALLDAPTVGEHSAPTDTAPVASPKTGGAAPSRPLPRLAVQVVTPASGDRWMIGKNHQIAWNNEPGVSGGLLLVRADGGGAEVGWILPSTGPKQTSYTWDTRDVSVTRTGGTRTNLAPGSYRMKLTFDGKAADVVSEAFTVVGAGEGERVTVVVRLENVKVTPNSLEIRRGTPILFVNNDTRAQTLSGAGFPTLALAADEGVAALDTATLAPGTYNYYSNVYTYQAPGTLVIK